MLPNISGKIFPSSFDCFSTVSRTKIALRSIAVFAYDEFNSTTGRFTAGKIFYRLNTIYGIS
ncbi:hypothetical protein C3B55_00848 [Candidatus Pseudomonas adelgestsugas]|uniref:Uncharacterized protein n=2 Tax=Candidatus Pseudomonas adelgestsugas TaxID=1302376 RepID=A0ABX5RA94_9PSED|nr:hypothetical protein C3B55_00848 [Candidatus Pseudomonas adelgestsugas]